MGRPAKLRRFQLTKPVGGDVVAALNVALVLIPQSLAYATIAGLDPVYGLYAAVAAPIAGALVGSSPYLQTGPVAVTSLLTFGALEPLVAPGSAQFATLAAVLAILVGLIRMVLGLIGAGPIAYLMSTPVLVAFTSAAALLIAATQVNALTGVGSGATSPILKALDALSQPHHWSYEAVGLGALSFALLLVGRKISSFIPAALVAVVLGTVYSRFTGYSGQVVGAIDLSFSPPSGIDWADVWGLVVPAVIIAVVGFAEPASIARRYASMERRPWDANREFVGQGLANMASGLVGSFPVGGSFSRTSLNRLSGAKTRWSGAFTGMLVLIALPFLGSLAELPTAVLAGLVIAAVVNLVDFKAMIGYWRFSRPQFFVGLITFSATMIAAPAVERGVLIGVAAALAVHLWREMRVTVPVELHGQTLHLVPTGVLYFASTPAVERTMHERLAEHPDVKSVVLHLDKVGRLDLTGALMVIDVLQDALGAGRTVSVTGANDHARQLLSRATPAGLSIDLEGSGQVTTNDPAAD